ncbi:hypothetical protein VNO80_28602 [Phaseolus coccineus]|uniref:Uncharacterized protein n=1 Tax=Phaseolus coccineus TaxID=3886 RepID=A0AAN9L9W5_PHACN
MFLSGGLGIIQRFPFGFHWTLGSLCGRVFPIPRLLKADPSPLPFAFQIKALSLLQCGPSAFPSIVYFVNSHFTPAPLLLLHCSLSLNYNSNAVLIPIFILVSSI